MELVLLKLSPVLRGPAQLQLSWDRFLYFTSTNKDMIGWIKCLLVRSGKCKNGPISRIGEGGLVLLWHTLKMKHIFVMHLKECHCFREEIKLSLCWTVWLVVLSPVGEKERRVPLTGGQRIDRRRDVYRPATHTTACVCLSVCLEGEKTDPITYSPFYFIFYFFADLYMSVRSWDILRALLWIVFCFIVCDQFEFFVC